MYNIWHSGNVQKTNLLFPHLTRKLYVVVGILPYINALSGLVTSSGVFSQYFGTGTGAQKIGRINDKQEIQEISYFN